MKGLQLTTVQQGLLYLALGCLLSGAIYLGGIVPAQTRVAALEEADQVQAQQLVRVRALAQQEDYAEYAQELARQEQLLQERLPQPLELEERVAQYYALARQEGVELQRLQLPPQGGDQSRLLLQAQGPYYALLNFLQALEGGGSYVRLEQLQLQGEEQGLVRLGAQLLLPQGKNKQEK